MAKKHAWYICPNCRSRLAVEHDHTGEVRCRNCSTLLRPAKHTASTAPKQRGTGQDSRDEDEYRLAPLGEEATTSSQGRPVDTATSASASDLQNLRARRERTSDGESETSKPAAAVGPGAPWMDEIEIRDDERYKPEPPPRWTFFSGVFTYPWRPQAILPWVVQSIGIAMLGAACLLIIAGLMSGSREGVLMAGFFILGLVWLVVLTGSYAAACLFAVIETTAYNFDAAYDWPEPDWRERFSHFLWVGWCSGLALSLLVVPTSLAIDDLQARAWAVMIGMSVLFPIFVLSTLETNSLVPFSSPVWRSLARDVVAWITFYVLSSVVIGISGVATDFLYRRFGLLSVVASGPLWATSILIYARLLGRLAWRIMQPGEMQLESWRKLHQSTLAAELRQRRRDEEGLLEK